MSAFTPINVVALSGGMDSATLLGDICNRYRDKPKVKEAIHAVGFSYGSKHNPYENRYAAELAAFYNVPMTFLRLDFMENFESNLLRRGGDIPEGHYEAESMSQTVVPGRNMIFASILAGFVWSLTKGKAAGHVWLGVHSGDHAIYPDCRPDFLEAMKAAVHTATDGHVHLAAPYIHMDKTRILELGVPLGVPYERTRTCYKDQEMACGKCGACQERLEAFRNIGMDDPIPYESREPLPKESAK